MPTGLDTAGLRELGAEVLGRAVFTARGTNAIFADQLKTVIDQLTAGDIGEGQARTALYETLDALGYTPEGGFPGDAGQVPPAVRGTLQDLRSFRRMDLIVRTQLDLMTGAGEQFRGHQPERLAQFPAWELVRVSEARVPRDWPSRFAISGGKISGSRMIALKGDPVWGELGSYGNFQDALGVDHPPFAFNSGMGWREISLAEVEQLDIRGPKGETAAEWLASRPATFSGRLPLPSPQLSLQDVAPDLVDSFRRDTQGTSKPNTPQVLDYSDLLESELKNRRDTYQSENPNYSLEGANR